MDSLLRFLAISVSAVVALGFLLFAADEMERGSKTQQQAIGEGTGNREQLVVEAAPGAVEESRRERRNGDFRELVDDANDVLLQPFSGVVESDSNWVTRGVPALLALLVYGLGLGLLANFLPKTSQARDWRTA